MWAGGLLAARLGLRIGPISLLSKIVIRAYLEERATRATTGLERPGLAGVARKLTPWGFRQNAKLHLTTLYVPVSRARARSLARESRGLMLHLGSGIHRLDGWLNVDLVSMDPDLVWDLRRSLPFPDGCARACFLEHVLEHFTLEDVLDVLAECHRVLEPGGIVRVGVPDFGSYMRSYAGDGAFIENKRPGRPTRLLAVAEVALSHGHRSVWDGETLEQVLAEAGFEQVRECKFGESALEPVPDAAHREAESVYAEGVKPSPSAGR
jgi:predicted SAM-dependent methyltransferase